MKRNLTIQPRRRTPSVVASLPLTVISTDLDSYMFPNDYYIMLFAMKIPITFTIPWVLQTRSNRSQRSTLNRHPHLRDPGFNFLIIKPLSQVVCFSSAKLTQTSSITREVQKGHLGATQKCHSQGLAGSVDFH